MSVSADFLRSQIDYTAWASLRLLDAAGALTAEELKHDFRTADGSILGTLAHIYAGDRIWLARLSGAPVPEFIAAGDRDFAVLQSAWPPLLEEWKKWAAGLTGERVIEPFSYVDLRGRHWTQPLWQLVLHVVNHGTHHRGQVAGFLRSLSHTPPPTDLHYYYR
ncbi:MAG TPA: DinB family protein [Bryobacteraceae bacterium]|jgi:uncharacterized damage-inducible protein DinB|nr:DinB family protein [Bryobacteraceae bacterium]